jgi:hypothetical protein
MNIERETMKSLRDELNAALKTVLGKHNLLFNIGTITFKPGESARMKLTVTQPGKDVKVSGMGKVTKLVIGKNYFIRGVKYQYVEHIPRRYRFPHVFLNVKTGRRYKFTDTVYADILPV